MNDPTAPVRVGLVEGEASSSFLDDLSAATGLTLGTLDEYIRAASDRVASALGLSRPLRVSGASVQAVKFAGLVRLAPGIEVEVAPKFLWAGAHSWREDFFLVATLSHSGRVFPRDRLRAGYADRGDLASLVGRVMVDLFWESYRRPLRVYRRTTVQEFALDGEVDAEDLLLPGPDGFEQEVIALSRSNTYGATIREAVTALLPDIRTPEVRQQLLRVYEALSPQMPRLRGPTPAFVPSRHRRWQPLYDLARQVLAGLGVGFDAGGLSGPGYVFETWRAWQALVLAALEFGVDRGPVLGEHSFPLGKRNGRILNVYPDVTLGQPGAEPLLLVDAKYKARGRAKKLRMEESDVYEALAFMEASGSRRVVLLYPRAVSDEGAEPGTAFRLGLVEVGDRKVLGYEVECRGISQSGLEAFGRQMVETVPLLRARSARD